MSVAALIGVAGVGAASTLRNQPEVVTTSAGNVTLPERRAEKATPVSSSAVAPTPAVVLQSAPAAAPADSAPAVAVPARPATGGGFVLVEGKTQLTDSIYAMRTGDSVIVNFDAYGYRTRRFDKFEQSLQRTLPLVFGRMATAGLDTLGKGELVTNHDIVRSLATDGMEITLENGATVRIRALTRVVTDGPIAIGYLATIER